MKKVFATIMSVLLLVSLCSCASSDKHKDELKVPLSNDYISGVNYKDAVEQFETAGFKNVETEKIEDLITGWINKDGEVEAISINGKTDFRQGAWVPKDAHVVIKYHTFASGEDDVNETSDTKNESTTKEVTQKVTTTSDLTKSKRAAVVAITNAYADDVYKSDGYTIDTAKLHSFSDLNGYYIVVNDWGKWTGKNKNTWHGENLSLEVFSTELKINASLDVTYNDKNYIVSNIEGSFGDHIDLSELEESTDSSTFLNVSQKLVEKGRSKKKLQEKDKSDVLDEFSAQQAFEAYGKENYPYGFKCHWFTDCINAEQNKTDGSWFLKVGVTITNQYGAKYKTVAEGKISGTSDNPKIDSFYVYTR